MDPAELYRLPPEDFTAARDAAAKQARADGDADRAKEIKALRRPSTAAWLVDLLAVEDAALLEELLALGPALAEAQAGGSGDALRELGAQRRQLVGAVTDRAIALAGRPVTSAVREEVAGTLEAALADPASADAVRSGRLVRALTYAGFGGVDLAGAVADAAPATGKGSAGKGSAATSSAGKGSTGKSSTGKSSTGKSSAGKGSAGKAKGKGSTGKAKGERRSADEGPDPEENARRGAALAAAEADALAAAGALDDAVRACERLASAAEQAAEDAAAAQEQVARARDALAAAERAAAEAEDRQRAAEQQSRAALDGVRDAQQQEEQARRALDRLRRNEEKA